jgi:hypothetical protein
MKTIYINVNTYTTYVDEYDKQSFKSVPSGVPSGVPSDPLGVPWGVPSGVGVPS